MSGMYEWQRRRAEFTPTQQVVLALCSSPKWRWRKIETIIKGCKTMQTQALSATCGELHRLKHFEDEVNEHPLCAIRVLDNMGAIVVAMDADDELFLTLKERAPTDEARGDDFNETAERDWT